MLKSYFRIAFRSLSRQRLYTITNIIGLSTGIAAFAFVMLWISDELSYDQFHTHAERIYRVAGSVQTDTETFAQAVTPAPAAHALVQYFPEVENAVRIDKNDATVEMDDEKWIEKDILLTDPSFFDVFSFRLIQGNPATALSEPYQAVISETMAKKYFADTNPIGQTLTIYRYDPEGNGASYQIVGVIEDVPPNSHFTYNMLLSFKTYEHVRLQNTDDDGWFDNSFYTYLLLTKDADPRALEAKLPQFIDHYMGEGMQEYHVFYTYFLQPLQDIYLTSHLRYEVGATSSTNRILVFATIGIFILVLACINYINLATTISAQRAKEVGIRKVLGALRGQLVIQHLAESVTVAFISLVMALFFMELTKPLFHDITGKTHLQIFEPVLLYLLLILTLMVGIISGIFPAIFVSGAKATNAIKGLMREGTSNASLRRVLVVFQFTISLILICGALIVSEQMKYIDNKDLGYDKENVLLLRVNGSYEVFEKFDAFKASLLQHAHIRYVARSNSKIVGGLSNAWAETEDAAGNPVSSSIYQLFVDTEFIPAYDISISAGRNFSPTIAADSTQAFILNEAAVGTFGWGSAEEAIGKRFKQYGNEGEVVGVVKNFHYNNLHHRVEPLAIAMLGRGFSSISIRFTSENLSQTLELIRNQWKSYFPESVFDFAFLDESVKQQYLAEQRFFQVFRVFTIICLLIACLGLFGLASYAAQKRTKEVGIRKVMGASVNSLVLLLSKDFTRLILLSFLIAAPISYFFMHRWLQEFSYQIEISIWFFVVTFMLALLAAWLTTGYHALRTALTNPVDSLRNE